MFFYCIIPAIFRLLSYLNLSLLRLDWSYMEDIQQLNRLATHLRINLIDLLDYYLLTIYLLTQE